jgi:putative intracellular protease/amidase
MKAPRGFKASLWRLDSLFFIRRFEKEFFKRRKKMKKMVILLAGMVLVAPGVVSLESQVYGQNAAKVLMIPREGFSADLDLMIKMEVGVMRLLLKNAGITVDVATPSGMPILGTSDKITDIKLLRNIKLEDYAGVIIPCMAVGSIPGPPVSPKVIEIVKKALADGKPVAANGNAATTLAEAGVLKGKKYSFQRDPLKPTATGALTDERFTDAIYRGSGMVQDGQIITSGICPNIEKTQGLENGTVKLTKAFIAAVAKK